MDEFRRVSESLRFGRVLENFSQVWSSLREFLTSLREFGRVGRVLDKIGTAWKSFWTSMGELRRVWESLG